MRSRNVRCCLVVLVAVFLLSKQTVFGQSARPEEVTFTSGKLTLHGFLYKPQGNGPFPVILYNHGSEQNPGTKLALGQFFSSKGYFLRAPPAGSGTLAQ